MDVIQERERSVRAAGITEGRFRALAENAVEAIVTLDTRDTVVYANPAAARIFGYSVDELVGSPFTRFIPPRLREAHAAGLRRYLETGTRRIAWDGLELPGLRSDGSEVALEVTFGEHEEDGRRFFTGVMRDVSQRRRNEEALRETTEALDAVVRGSPLAIVGLDRESRVTRWNPAAERIFGWSAEEVVGRSLPIVPPEREDASADLRRAALEGRVVTARDTERRRRDGSLVEVSLSVAPLRSSGGGIEGVMGMYADISERRSAERARDEREAQLRFLTEAGRELAASLEVEETLRSVVRLAVPTVADWCAVYLFREDVLRLVEVAHREPRKESLAREIRTRYPDSTDHPAGIRAAIGSREPVLVARVTDEMLADTALDERHLALLRGLGTRSILHVPLVARGEPVGGISLGIGDSGRSFDPADRDFAEELAGRAALAVDNARLFAETRRRAGEEAALRRAAEAVAATFTIEEVIQRIADSALVAAGADGAFVERIGEGVREVEVVAVSGESVPSVGSRAPYRGSLAEHVVERGEPMVVDLPDATDAVILAEVARTCATCSALVVPLLDGGEPIGALVLVRGEASPAFRDDEVGRAFTFGELAGLAFRKVHLLHESERRREELERVTESRARLIRGFSHDVKNPLGAADGYLELLEEGIGGPALHPAQRETVRRVRRSIGSALGLIHDLVELARAESGEIHIQTAPTDVTAVAREIAEEHRARAERKGLELRLSLPGHVPVVRSDPSRARQVLGNLVSNGVKYTDVGWVEVAVRVRSDAVAVSVSDSGRGIPEDQRHRLFREFSRIEDGGGAEGAGLGLAISRRIARSLGGDVTVESEAGRGSTFTLWLPRDAADGGPPS